MPGDPQTDVVTGAFSYSGAAIARELLAAGHRVRTLTGHPGRAPAGTQIDVHPLDFTDPDALRASLRGAWEVVAWSMSKSNACRIAKAFPSPRMKPPWPPAWTYAQPSPRMRR